MKKTIATLATLALAATAAAHNTAVPHTHSAWEINWQMVFTGLAALAVVATAIVIFRKRRSR